MTMTLIETVTLASNATSITFMNIPQDATDLLVTFSGRSSGTLNGGIAGATFSTNGSSFTGTMLQGNGSSVASNSASIDGLVPDGTTTANTFSNIQVYFPNYAGSATKSWSMDVVTENNATLAIQKIVAGSTGSTNAITTIYINAQTSSGDNFVTGTTASLYKIKKA